MKIITWNVNGIRAVVKKGFLDFLEKEQPDVLCLQEMKAEVGQIPAVLSNWLGQNGYLSYLNPSSLKAGHSGTAVFTKIKPMSAGKTIGLERFDKEGRVIWLKFPKFTLYNFYITHGDRTQKHMAFKLTTYDYLWNEVNSFQKDLGTSSPRSNVLVGDFNVAHKEIDLARPKDNQKNTGFTLPEREKIDKLLALGFVDSFRYFNKEGGNYTWWSNFNNARARNIGWRIDYCFVSESLVKNKKLKNAFIMPKVMGSDHCPAGIDIAI